MDNSFWTAKRFFVTAVLMTVCVVLFLIIGMGVVANAVKHDKQRQQLMNAQQDARRQEIVDWIRSGHTEPPPFVEISPSDRVQSMAVSLMVVYLGAYGSAFVALIFYILGFIRYAHELGIKRIMLQREYSEGSAGFS